MEWLTLNLMKKFYGTTVVAFSSHWPTYTCESHSHLDGGQAVGMNSINFQAAKNSTDAHTCLVTDGGECFTLSTCGQAKH